MNSPALFGTDTNTNPKHKQPQKQAKQMSFQSPQEILSQIVLPQFEFRNINFDRVILGSNKDLEGSEISQISVEFDCRHAKKIVRK